MDKLGLIARELGVSLEQVSRVVAMLEEGNTIPFIARYRKEMTGALDEVQLRDIRDRFEYLTEMEDRRESILSSIDEQGKLTDALKAQIMKAQTKQALEDLYLPYKRKKRTRAAVARDLGLEPLAELIRDQETPKSWLDSYLQQETVELDEAEALHRARDIVAEWISEDVVLKERIREICWGEGEIQTEVRKEFAAEKTKFEMYYQYSEPVRRIPAHRFLAVRRGEEEGILRFRIEVPKEAILEHIESGWLKSTKGEEEELKLAIQDGYQRLIAPSVEVEMRMRLKTEADEDSINVFGQNLKELLLAPLGGAKMILGIDPGFRSGSKWVVVDQTGKFLEKGVIFPTNGKHKLLEAEAILGKVLMSFPCDCICIGNGTASREVMQFVRNFLKRAGKEHIQPIFVNESGASIYSASDIAREEFPDLDLTFRGSISIARRFQDPLAELVKIDAKSIGVGQYQHDVNQTKLKRSLDEVVESCVNFVGVNLNTASASLLSYVSGLSKTMAKNIVSYRDQNGAFKTRKALLKVPRFGPKAFEQSAGFMRIPQGDNPLDQSAVHPENYPIVLKMAKDLQLTVEVLIGNEKALGSLDLSAYRTEKVGFLTLKDIVDELKKPGRDPRTAFIGAKFDENVQEIKDLAEGMELEGTVTNLTKFGVFVDLGVHQDGLVHLSEMADRFIKDASEVCGVGEVVKVRVLSVDVDRKRIALSMKTKGAGQANPTASKNFQSRPQEKKAPKTTGNMAVDLAALANKFKNR
ncbi:MAG: RNA-binding transcriptional accessory protein [SAR324 cluster bacterium]|uniref:RNA-binding transcriptional accessory protein n=1 Tax=SAR324 cluster bacterium TaxID=2024889 RepID=A0A2A4T0A2_9DELT|nr:MAG: RNA-binding transcriptional accessory protein [SAR324 cluster bacterium]